MPLHRQSKLFVELIRTENRPPWQAMPIEKSREIFTGFDAAFGEGPILHQVENASFDGVPVRIYRPSPSKSLPCVMYFHGGGWVIGNLKTHDTLCRHIAEQSGCVVIAVDYRLAPEHKYPAAIDDCYQATSYAVQHATELGIDASRLVVAGDSAGGNLAGAVSLRARDEIAQDTDGPRISLQVLIYPAIEADYTTSSYRDFAEGFGLTAETMQWMWEQYWTESNPNDKMYVVLTDNDLSGLPKTHLITAEYDVLRDEGEAFADKLKAAGVDITMKRYDGMLHGFVHFSALFDVGLVAIREFGQLIRETVG